MPQIIVNNNVNDISILFPFLLEISATNKHILLNKMINVEILNSLGNEKPVHAPPAPFLTKNALVKPANN